jgi:hypothetical protein
LFYVDEESEVTRLFVIVLLSTALAFACSKKIELTRLPEPFMLVNLNPFIFFEDGSYEDVAFDFSSINQINPSIKQFRPNGLDNLYYSELDSNTLVFITVAPVYGQDFGATIGLFFIRPCSTDKECDDYEKKNPITDIFKYELSRLQQSGFYPTTQKYADSISEYIIDKFNTYSDSTGKSIYNGLVYNDRCWLGDNATYHHNDNISEASIPCPMIPSEVRAEFDSCNAMLDAQEIKILSLPQVGSARLDIQGRQISVSGIEGPTEITIFSLMGQTLEQHNTSGLHTTVTTQVPTGRYIVQLKNRLGTMTRQLLVR